MVKHQSKRSLSRIQLLFIICIGFAGITFGQTNHYMFNKAMEKDPDQVSPFAIVNEGVKTLRALEANKVLVKTVMKDWIYITSTPRLIEEMKRKGEISDFHFGFSSPVMLNDSARQKHFVNEVHSGLGGLTQAYTGQNVLIGYIDDALDVYHPDFWDANGQCRVLKLWDQTNSTDVARVPAAYGYGQVYDSTDFNDTIYIVPGAQNHGTTVTGAGSGGGRITGANKGMAPESKIVFVKSNQSANNWTLTVADACDLIFKEADALGIPAVINISMGSYFGSHDGKDPATLLMDNMLTAKAGRAIVAAAGNGGGDYGNFHVHGTATSDTSFVWMKPDTNAATAGFGPNTLFFDMWGDFSSIQNMKYAFGANKPGGTFEERGRTQFRTISGSLVSLIRDTIYNDNGDRLGVLEIYPGMQSSVFEMFALFTKIDTNTYNFSFLTTGTGSYDMWTGANYGRYRFVDTIPDASVYPKIVNYNMPDSLQTIVSDFHCSDKIVSVGNFQNRIGYIDRDGNPQTFSSTFSRSGQLAITSSIGPTRDNRQKPDISAAGDGSLSPGSLTFMSITSLNAFIDSSGWFVRNGGTSMSSPVVAGIAGLYFEKCPDATFSEFMTDLKATAYTDQFTGTIPNYGYGYGKVHALNLMLIACDQGGVGETAGSQSVQVYPNPSADKITLTGLKPKAKLALYDLQGKEVQLRFVQNNILDISKLESGVYILKVEQDNQILNIKIERL